MTDREILIANNKRIEALQKVLKNKIAVSAISNEINLPGAFRSCTTLYTFKVTPDVVLISAPVADIGVWRYKFSTKDLKQVYTEGQHWSSFFLIETGCVMASTASASNANVKGLLFYDLETDEVVRLTSNGFKCNKAVKVGNSWVFAPSGLFKGVIEYVPETKEVFEHSVSFGATNWSWSIIRTIEGKNQAIISNSYTTDSENYGLMLIDTDSHEWKQIYNYGSYWGYSDSQYIQVGNLCLLSNNINSSVNSIRHTDMVLVYNIETQTVTEVGPFLATMLSFKVVNDKCFIYTEYHTDMRGFYVLDLNSLQLDHFYSDHNRLGFAGAVGDYVVMATNTSSSTLYPATLLYNCKTNTVIKIYDLPRYACTIEDKKIFFATVLSSDKGWHIYNTDSGETTIEWSTYNTSYYRLAHTDQLNNLYFAYKSSSSSYCFKWSNAEQKMYQVGNQGPWDHWVTFDNYTLAGSASDNKTSLPSAYLIDDLTGSVKTFSQIIWDNAEKIEENKYLLSHSNKDKMPRAVLLDTTAGTIDTYKIYIEG